ncbi:elongation factor Ts, mitochondrial [Patella vulgata]|uniref:elongation factor Ts, mitochondrial n=1 Tax=Patella vulgata TaxID=6465 RepID=UPI00217FEEB0|nr:elongation factor Ts, mitochondrial [Patella vulgata]
MLQLKCWTSAFGSVRRMTTAIDKSLLSKLRKKTGFSFINCKNALLQFENDLVKAEEWLKEQAQKEGWAKATKLQSRPMSQGLVGLRTDPDNTSATLIEVNCETDFVARNKKFVNLVTTLTTVCNNHFTSFNNKKILLEKQDVNSIVTSDGRTIGDLVAYEVGNIGENMALRRAVHMMTSPNTTISTYVHVSGDEIEVSENCQLGKYGTIVEFERIENKDQTLYLVADPFHVKQQICQHIVGMNPKTVGTQDDEPVSNKDEETMLLYQEFLTDPTILVKDVLQENCLIVKDFIRFECGETLPGEEL